MRKTVKQARERMVTDEASLEFGVTETLWFGLSWEGNMKTVFRAAVLMLVFGSDALSRNAPNETILNSADAIAYVQVVSVSEDLKDGVVTRRATLRDIGRSYAPKNNAAFEVPFGLPSKLGDSGPSSDSPFFILGRRCIVVLKLGGAQPIVLRQIYVSDHGKIEEPRIFQPLGFDRGADADFAVERLIAAMKKESVQLPEPTIPSSRGQP